MERRRLEVSNLQEALRGPGGEKIKGEELFQEGDNEHKEWVNMPEGLHLHWC